MSKKELFTTVLRGFHKAEVTRYLTEVIQKYEKEKAEIDRRYAGMESARSQKAAEEKAELQSSLQKADERIALLEAELAERTADPDREKLLEAARQIKGRMEEARQLEQHARDESEKTMAAARQEAQTILSKAKESSLQRQSLLEALKEKLDRQSAELMEQKIEASQILANAKKEAAVIIENAQAEADRICEEAKEEAKEIVLQGQQQAALEKERQMQQVQGEIASAKEKLGEMVRQVDELSARLEYFGSICQ